MQNEHACHRSAYADLGEQPAPACVVACSTACLSFILLSIQCVGKASLASLSLSGLLTYMHMCLVC